jgi:hypothetical protein
MMSTKSNGTRYLTKEELKKANEAYADRSKFTSYELTWLGLTDADGYGEQEDKNMHVNTTPVDPETSVKKKAIDIRKDVKKGGGD